MYFSCGPFFIHISQFFCFLLFLSLSFFYYRPNNILYRTRYMPPITPSAWKNIRLVDNYPPVCPQSLPHLDAGMDALFKMPRYRFSQLRNVKAFLGNYSEDCLYLNMFVPKTGENSSQNNNRAHQHKLNDFPRRAFGAFSVRMRLCE